MCVYLMCSIEFAELLSKKGIVRVKCLLLGKKGKVKRERKGQEGKDGRVESVHYMRIQWNVGYPNFSHPNTPVNQTAFSKQIRHCAHFLTAITDIFSN